MKTIFRSSLLLALLSCSTWISSSAQAQSAATDMTFDARNGDQKGKIMIGDADVAFESLTDGNHSHTWQYSEIRSLEKKGRKDMRVRPYKGSTYDFQLSDGKLRDRIYDAITAKVLMARSQAKQGKK